MAKVVIENLVKTYPEKSGPGVRAVNGINLTVADREFMVLVGLPAAANRRRCG